MAEEIKGCGRGRLPLIGIASFTDRGGALSARIAEGLRGEYEVRLRHGALKDWCRDCFSSAQALVFVGACGIAVRTIAPFLKDKTEDPAVLVVDEAGRYVISLLSGHLGGANALAGKVADQIGAQPVITTASDVNGKIAIDVFAKKNGLAIGSMKDAREIAAAVLRGDRVGVLCTGEIRGSVPPELTLLGGLREEIPGNASPELRGGAPGTGPFSGCVDHLIWISEYQPERGCLARYFARPSGTVLHLIPRSVALGIGCRRGKPVQELEAVALEAIRQAGISPRSLWAAASIDLKKGEPGILELCDKYGIPFVTYPAEELARVPGEFSSSPFVQKTTGVDNVCERAAFLAAGEMGEAASGTAGRDSSGRRGDLGGHRAEASEGAEPGLSVGHAAGWERRSADGPAAPDVKLIGKRFAENGVTAALASREWRVCFEK